MELFNRILIPTDGSDKAKAATGIGLKLANLMNSEVTAISVADVSQLEHFAAGPNLVDLERFVEEGARTAVNHAREEGVKAGLVVKTIVKKGTAAQEIIRISDDYDLIVMSCLGHTGISAFLMGGVAEKVARFANCSVLVVRPHKAELDGHIPASPTSPDP
ncbi:MAG TPA: universal stress protein [Methanomassiliicoccales archaeon]|nr:universal stress protein [Methanomassiliicoccales archaeon]